MKGYKSVGASGYGKAPPSKSRRKTGKSFHNTSQNREGQKSQLIKKYLQDRAPTDN
jgi:hypothetical protein